MKKSTERPLTTPADHHARLAAATAEAPAKAIFGRQQATAPQAPAELNLNEWHGGGTVASTIQPSRGTIPAFIATIAGILLGGWYFIHSMLAFKTAMLANETSVLGPYPNFAVSFVILPALCGGFYFLMDYLGQRTGIPPFTSAKGLTASILIGILFLLASRLPPAVIRHADNNLAAQHGYTYCDSLFDPQRVHIYALQSYVAGYGCPTVAPPQ